MTNNGFKKCSKCKKEKELNETNFELDPLNNYTKNCITCLEYNRNNRKKDETKLSCLVCKVEMNKGSFKNHCKTIKHQNNLNGIKKEIKLSIMGVYKIYCLDDKIKSMYIGKTKNCINRNRAHHNNCINPNYRDYNLKVYKFIRNNGNWINWKMEMIKECNEEDLEKLELYYYEIINHDLNDREPILYTKLKNSVLYKIYCKNKNIKECYIGSTSNFNHRKQTHKSSCVNSNCKGHNNKLYQFIRDNGNWDNWSMEIIKKLENCNSVLELIKQEQEAIDNCEYPLLNDETAYISFEEKRENKINRDKKNSQKRNDKLKEDRIICNFCNCEMRRDKFKRHCEEADKHKINLNKFIEDLNKTIKLLKNNIIYIV